jgi:hypothetical protein
MHHDLANTKYYVNLIARELICNYPQIFTARVIGGGMSMHLAIMATWFDTKHASLKKHVARELCGYTNDVDTCFIMDLLDHGNRLLVTTTMLNCIKAHLNRLRAKKNTIMKLIACLQ